MRVTLPMCLLLMISATCMASDFKELARKVPGGGNAVMAIDVAKTLETPIAKKNGWDKKIADGTVDRPLYFPPEADKVLAAAQIDISRNFARNWDVSVFGMTQPIPLRLVARAEGGYIDQIDGVDAAWIPSDAYIMDAGDNALIMQSPANRQAAARWLADRKGVDSLSISDYLSVAISTLNVGPHVILALDTDNAIQTHRVRQQLEQSGFAEKHSVDIEQLTSLLSGMQGVLLQITFTDKTEATATISFASAVSVDSTVAKALVLATLQSKQMELPGVDSWKCTIVDNSIVIGGDLPMDSLRRIMSLMEPASTKFSSLKDANVEEASGDDMAKNSLAYFTSVQTLLKDLRQKSGSSNGDAYWIDRYAARIDRLPILHVDDDLLEYGQNVSETLRVMSGSRKMANLQGGAASRNALNSGGFSYDSGNSNGYGYGNYNYSSPRSRERDAGAARANAAAAGSAVKAQGWTLIDNATIDIRRELTKRYDMEF